MTTPDAANDDELVRLRAQVARLQLALDYAGRDGAPPPSSIPHTSTSVPPLDTALSAISAVPRDVSASSINPATPSSLHALLLLADSALPLSAFAFSSGLESYLAHHTTRKTIAHPAKISTASHATTTAAAHPAPPIRRPPPHDLTPLFLRFLEQTLAAQARQSVPFLLAAFDNPPALQEWDDTLDAATLCTVARRQSVEQGRALLAVWARGLRGVVGPAATTPTDVQAAASHALLALATALKTAPPSAAAAARSRDAPPLAHGHLAPTFGATCRAAGVPRHEAAYVFLLNAAKGVVSAAVRAGVCGPFRQQEVLASRAVRGMIERGVAVGEEVFGREGPGPGGAGQVVPLLDVWGGRHEVLYSRIFNS